ncbi:GNAT family N-acetyltransferase [Ottowia thiooxydans]|uniref:GNAT family N-acetyltransferase n=1 Tax=Ottowia thiooxydans TaxID=219182 RepID=UPI00048D5008|nr:GNAT family N-acetyltransferase [Ottowia thiooxydans]
MANTEPNALSSDHLAERLAALTPGDLDMLNRLVMESHWNQLPADWHFFFEHGHVLVVRNAESRIIASGAVLPMDADTNGHRVAWISMILVLPEVRGQGLGRRVFEACLRSAQAADYLPMLDATPQGEPLYTQFGFVPLSHITRWRREARGARASSAPAPQADLDQFVALDARALGFGRSALINSLQGRPTTHCVSSSHGFTLVRAGRTAHHIGPLLAEDEGRALELLQQAVDALETPVLIDAPQQRPVLTAALQAAGFVPQRDFTRMAWVPPGRTLPQGQPHFIHAIAGPEFA